MLESGLVPAVIERFNCKVDKLGKVYVKVLSDCILAQESCCYNPGHQRRHPCPYILLQLCLVTLFIRVIANAHARLHTTAVRESAALHSGKELYTHSRVFPAGSAPRAFPHMLPSLRRKSPRYLIIYLFSAVYYALFIALCCDHRYRSHVHVRT